MRIVQLLTQDRGGPVDHVLDLAPALVRRGHDVCVIGPDELAERVHACPGVEWRACAIPSFRDLGATRRLAGILRDWRPDLVHCQDRRAGLVGRVLSLRLRLPSVYTLHGAPDGLAHLVSGNRRVGEQRRRDRLMYLVAERLLTKLARSRVIVASAALAGYAQQHVGIPADSIDVVPNGINLDRFPPGDKTGPADAVWLGLMGPVKRLDVLLAAVADVPELRLTLVGDGPLRSDITAQVTAKGLADRVHLCGFQSDAAAWLAPASVAVLTSDAENCPLFLLQAMSSACAVVATSVGGVPELVRHGEEGLLVPAGDVAGLAAALDRLHQDPELARRMGLAARRRAQGYGVDAMTDRTLQAYETARRGTVR